MAEAVVKISVADAASTRLSGLARELKELAKVAKSAGAPDAQRLSAGASQLQTVADKFGVVQKEASGASQALGTAKSALGAFTSSAGLGFGKSLLGLGGAVAFAAAAGKVIGDSIKLATEFERVSQRATFSLALGQGNLGAQLNSLKSATGSYANLGLDKTQAAELIGTYGSASGATLRQSINAGQSIAQYGRGFGMDPTALAAQMGMLAQYAGKNAGSNASEVFGAARSAGDAGRRPTELLGTAVNLLAQMQASNPMASGGLKSALKEIVGVTKLGGYYQTQQGMQSTIGGFNAIGNSISSNPALTNLAMKSGFSIPDILFGSNDPSKLNKLFQNMYKQTGGNRNIMASVISSILPGAQGRDVFEAIMAGKGNILGKYDKVSAKSLAAAVTGYKGTVTGQLDVAGANVHNAEINVGDSILKVIAPRLADAAIELNKLSEALTSLHFPEGMGSVTAALGAVAVALALKGGVKLPAFARAGGAAAAAGGAGWGSRLANFARAGLGVLAGPVALGVAATAALVATVGRMPGGTDDEDSNARDADFKRRVIANKVGGPWNTAAMLAAIRQQESGGNYQARGIDIPSMGGRAIGAYQFMPDTLMGNAANGSTGYAQQMDGNLFKKLGREGFIKHFLADPDMQNRYMGAMMQNGIAAGVSSPLDYGVYHLSGEGSVKSRSGFRWWKYKQTHGGGADSRDGLGTSQTTEGQHIQDNYNAIMSKYSRYPTSAAVANSQHPAHQGNNNHGHTGGGGSGGSSTHKLATGNGGHIQITAKYIPGHDRTKPGTYRS